ncbi:calcium-binding protein [Virgisporangium aurantiacum]|uniref:Hemolysin-type calcium-binding repeat-containing protein n=1 Tax=Virgisporangium aurantiacum TaxID=175570 RepID=A0A8J3ZLJ3_9ACTN|nr:calcium-binding protein [Virgisporangium aurantiacum]GIJ63620.1 hypothetical protein Vau01_111360 [Virgisporangium aurantiacum]
MPGSSPPLTNRLAAATVIGLVFAGGLVVATPAQAAVFTCAGEPATIVASGGGTTRGTAGPDVIVTFDRVDVIWGRGGDDLICSGGGGDLVRGEDGNDIIYSEDGFDEVSGGTGDDTMVGGPGNDKLWGNGGTNVADGGPGSDQCTLSRIKLNCERT